MSDTSISIVILSERSLPAVAGDAKDLYLPRLAPFSPNRASRGDASFTCSLLAMSDPSTTVVILSEHSLPAVAGDAKDLYLPRLAPFSPKRDSQSGVSFPCSPFVMSKEAIS